MSVPARRTARLELTLEIVSADFLLERALPALEAATDEGRPRALARVAALALPILEQAARSEEERVRGVLGAAAAAAHPEVLAAKLAHSRLEAYACPDVLAFSGAGTEEVAWALLRAARVAPPVSLGTEWDVLRALVDPARRDMEGVATLPRTLLGSAFLGRDQLETESGFALARSRSYATGWNGPAKVARIARALSRVTEAKLEKASSLLEAESSIGRRVYPERPGPVRGTELARAKNGLSKLKKAYERAAELGAGVFQEIEVV